LTLEKVFAKPDVAENGESALALAKEHSYDAIFLDVQMPNMDGFETCSRIHGTDANRSTPVVFVTCHGDFEARAKSTRVGGHELIAKPFLTFEVALKALTMVVETRLRSAATGEPSDLATENKSGSLAPAAAKASSARRDVSASNPSSVPARIQKRPDAGLKARRSAEPAFDNSSEQSTAGFAHTFFTKAPAQLQRVRAELQGLSRATDEEERKDILEVCISKSTHSTPKQNKRNWVQLFV